MFGQFLAGLGIFLYAVVIMIFIYLGFRFVNAVEKIADKFENK